MTTLACGSPTMVPAVPDRIDVPGPGVGGPATDARRHELASGDFVDHLKLQQRRKGKLTIGEVIDPGLEIMELDGTRDPSMEGTMQRTSGPQGCLKATPSLLPTMEFNPANEQGTDERSRFDRFMECLKM